MKERSPSDIRNIAIVGHGGAGKTTLTDHLLYAAGVVTRAGSVDAGTSLSDYDPEERQRHFSIDNSIFNFQWGAKSFNLIDTPGYLEFVGAATSVIPVVETALVAVHAAEGVQLNTRRMWEAAEKANVARAIVITHLDSENILFQDVLADIQESFGRHCVPLFLPVGLGRECSGVVDLLAGEKAPEGVVGDFDTLKMQLTESIVEFDDQLMETYLEGEEIGSEQLHQTFRGAMAAGAIVPVLCCAAEKGVGLKEMLRFMADCLPSPADVAGRVATDEKGEKVELNAAPEGAFCAQVFKSVTDVHVGKLAFFRVYNGSLGEDSTVQLARTGKGERLGRLHSVFGSEQREVSGAIPGDIISVSKVEELKIGDTLCEPRMKLTMDPIEFPKPMMSVAVEPRSRDDEQKISAGLQRLADGDPTCQIRRDQRSSELVVTGMSNLHLDVTLSRLKRRYGVEVDTREPSIPYLETIQKKAEGQYRHKKQTGGHGQYGEVYLRIEPMERGAGFEFVDEIKGGVIPNQFIPAVEKGVREVLDTGLLADCPIVDLRVAVYYGSYHSVDSSEAAFKIAGARAFQAAFEAAKPVLLEPIAKMEVTIPTEYMGDVTANLTGHRGRIQGMDHVGKMQVVQAEIPTAEVTGYSAELKSITGGQGSFSLEFSHYQIVPQHIQQQIIARRKAQKEESK